MGQCPDQVLFFKKIIAEHLLDLHMIVCIHIKIVLRAFPIKTDAGERILVRFL